MGKRHVIGTCALCASISVGIAHAQVPDDTQPRKEPPPLKEPFTAGKTQLGGGLDFGFATRNDEVDGSNPYGFGLGFDLGHTLGNGVYLGAEFNYFFGSTEQEFGVETNTNVTQYGVEFGFDAGVSSDLVMRPKLGIGIVNVSSDVDGGDFVDGASESGLFLPIGIALLCALGDGFIGGDFRYGLSLDEDVDASGLLIGIGAGVAF